MGEEFSKAINYEKLTDMEVFESFENLSLQEIGQVVKKLIEIDRSPLHEAVRNRRNIERYFFEEFLLLRQGRDTLLEVLTITEKNSNISKIPLKIWLAPRKSGNNFNSYLSFAAFCLGYLPVKIHEREAAKFEKELSKLLKEMKENALDPARGASQEKLR